MKRRHILALGFGALLASTIACGSSGSSSSTNCGNLQTCCDSSGFPQAEQPGCNTEMSANIDSACSDALTSYQAAGYCSGGSKGSSDDSDGGGGGGGGLGCSDLQTCCSSLSSDIQSGCNAIVQAGDDSACTDSLQSYQSANQC